MAADWALGPALNARSSAQAFNQHSTTFLITWTNRSRLAFLLCLLAGLWIGANVGFASNHGAVWAGLGLYFLGKAFFVGPILTLTAELMGKTREPQ